MPMIRDEAAEQHESAIKGLMILGRTREEAEAEMEANQKRIWKEMDDEWWDYDPSRNR